MDNLLTYNDKELFTLISEGDEAAFEQLFHRYLPRIQPIILQIVKVETVAQDIIQDVFLRLWLNREKLHVIEDPKSYLFRIVYNQSFKSLKKDQVREKASSTIFANQGYADAVTDLEHALDLAEVRRHIEIAIHELPEQSRQIYHLNRISGHKPQEIADQFGISVQSVRNSLTRSGKAIREYLESQGIVVPLFLLIFTLR